MLRKMKSTSTKKKTRRTPLGGNEELKPRLLQQGRALAYVKYLIQQSRNRERCENSKKGVGGKELLSALWELEELQQKNEKPGRY